MLSMSVPWLSLLLSQLFTLKSHELTDVQRAKEVEGRSKQYNSAFIEIFLFCFLFLFIIYILTEDYSLSMKLMYQIFSPTCCRRLLIVLTTLGTFIKANSINAYLCAGLSGPVYKISHPLFMTTNKKCFICSLLAFKFCTFLSQRCLFCFFNWRLVLIAPDAARACGLLLVADLNCLELISNWINDEWSNSVESRKITLKQTNFTVEKI